MDNGFDKDKLHNFLNENPDKIPCMCRTLRNEIEKYTILKFKSMSINELVEMNISNVGLINKKYIDTARYGLN